MQNLSEPDPQPAGERVIYRWGRWVWYYRALAVAAYLTIALAVFAFSAVIRDLLRTGTAADTAIACLVGLLLAACALWGWATWRQGASRVERIRLRGDGGVEVRTLNFTRRTLAPADVRRVEQSTLQSYPSAAVGTDDLVYEPTLTVETASGPSLRIDLQGQIVDRAAFDALFPVHRVPAAPRRRRPRGRPRRSQRSPGA